MNWIKSHSNFLSKLLCLAVVLIALAAYQSVARGWAAEEAANEAEIAEVEAYNAGILAELEQEEEEASEEENVSTYVDGVYSGSGAGFGGDISVSVTIENDRITDITIDSAAGEDESYLSAALEIVDEILAEQSCEVDTISGATFSSTGIRTAVQDALSQAVNSNGE